MSYYKVVTKDLKSIVQHSTAACIEYKIGEYVGANAELLRKGFGLCVFTSYTRAAKFVRGSGFKIFECKIGYIMDLPKQELSIKVARDCHTVVEWLDALEHRSQQSWWPRDTIMTNKVMLI